MFTVNRLMKCFAFTFIIRCLPAVVSAFSTTQHRHYARQIHNNLIVCPGGSNWTIDKYSRKVHCLSAEPNSRQPFSRRGFIDNCVATAACSVVVVSSPSKSIAETDVAAIPSNNNSNPTTSDSQQLLISRIQNEPTAFQESISGFVSGSLVSTAKTLVKYPLDTATVRLQMPNTQYTIQNLATLFSGSFDGITAPLISNIPAGAAFFAVKDATKSLLKNSGLNLPKWALTILAVGAAQPLYWLLRNPSEVIKTRLQVGAEGYYEGMSTLDAFQLALSNRGDNSTMDGFGELYQGYVENILYAFPADIIKFVVYDGLAGRAGKLNVSPVNGAMYGALSTAISQLATTPLDVLRNRIMVEVSDDSNTNDSLSYLGRMTKIANEEGAGVLFAGAWPRVAKAMLSGAIQFATYEETKQKMGELFMKR
ncbi:hypothetical protein ACHAXH_003848 [Discostella pseudostelligera]